MPQLVPAQMPLHALVQRSITRLLHKQTLYEHLRDTREAVDVLCIIPPHPRR